MRRMLSLLVLAVVAALFSVVAPPPATAGAVITGTVIQYGGAPVPGTTVRLHADEAGAPGAVIDTTTTNADGEFVLSPTIDADHWVEVVRNSMVQGGYVSDAPTGPSWVQEDPANATPVTPGTALGRVLALPSFISGVVVNAANGNRLRGIAVNIREVTHLSAIVGSDTTDTNGFFRIPIFGEDFALRLNGSARGFETGWRACDGTVVPSWGAACQSPIGRIGRVKLDRL
jgi:hypothetical protein